MRVTEKGQVTIPKAIRDRLKIGPGSEVDFVERADGIVEIIRGVGNGTRSKALLHEVETWFRQLEGTGDANLSADDIMAMTRDRGERNNN
ncbi:AbrB/MazE/SpoVT family DNA-binding domain-containing protein [Mesorhizobium sp. CAU 1732]|uniref:AbrB/MazE/SpoVT family DNA-binding domain-containing protein n=1 Tax=Mesorhizobium sp. CAU 1732 TaxID=3140358 RepID=UPI003261B18E